jgi:hypothetical protein
VFHGAKINPERKHLCPNAIQGARKACSSAAQTIDTEDVALLAQLFLRQRDSALE